MSEAQSALVAISTVQKTDLLPSFLAEDLVVAIREEFIKNITLNF